QNRASDSTEGRDGPGRDGGLDHASARRTRRLVPRAVDFDRRERLVAPKHADVEVAVRPPEVESE
ncbi:hypothetical protein ABTL53_19925, partial [Acinetobacter baumannii]